MRHAAAKICVWRSDMSYHIQIQSKLLPEILRISEMAATVRNMAASNKLLLIFAPLFVLANMDPVLLKSCSPGMPVASFAPLPPSRFCSPEQWFLFSGTINALGTALDVAPYSSRRRQTCSKHGSSPPTPPTWLLHSSCPPRIERSMKDL